MKAHEILMRLTAIGDFSDIRNNTKTLQEALNKLQVPKKFKDSFNDIFKDLEKEVNKYQKTLDSGLKTKGDLSGLEKSGTKIINLFSRLEKQMGQISTKDLEEIFEIDPSTLAKAKKDIEEVKTRLEKAFASGDPSKHLSNITETIEDLAKISKTKDLSKLNEAIKAKDFEEASKALEKLSTHANRFKESSGNKEKWVAGIEALKTSIDAIEKDPSLLNIYEDLRKVKLAFDNLEETEFNQNAAGLNDAKVAAGGLRDGINQLHNQTVEAGASALNLSNTLDHFKEKAAYFFGLSNSIELFKRAVRDAYESVKELDKVMTETAVVTDFTIGDMWEQLPEYSKRASELGVSIKGAYESATLYYQQGLKTDEVIAASSETLKMARIAGMDYAEATNYMTAALRGFNMEINEQSAKRVNDVYSELAAITASDTEEISKAMTKTASIADSANMEFETTAAFLAQIIETTREAPETAGTALKTVIARFQELKKDPAEIGEVEGEIVDANKIEGALRTIDVALRDTNGQFRDLDDVFLEIASKWNTLDLNTQRYIATMAAGSRQQSRFIAMMSDYDRTMELVNAANNSAGASQEQFEKTLESLESKVARLNNAWTNFTMGIANNTLIKVGVDSIYGLIEAINKMTDILPGGTSGIAKLAVSLVGLKAGGRIFDNLFKNFKEFQNKSAGPFDQATKAIGKSFSDLKKELSNRTVEINKILTEDFWTFSPKDYEQTIALFDNIDDLKNRRQTDLFLKDEIDQELLDSYDQLAGKLKEITNGEEVYQQIQKLGLTNDQKSLILTSANTRAKIQEILATKNLTKEETEARIQEELNNASTGKGIVLSFKDTIQKYKEALATKVLGKEATEAALRMGTLNKALLGAMGPAIGAVAIFAALAGTFAYANTHSPEAMFEKAQKATQKAADAANEAKSAYDNLLSGHDEYNNLQNKLDGLIKGTKEWEQALFEANQQVLELLQNYSGLKVTEREGKLEITNWDEVIEEQKKQLNIAQISVAVATTNEARTEVNTKSLEGFSGTIVDSLGGPQKLISDMAKAWQNQDAEALNHFKEVLNLTSEEFEELIPTLKNFIDTENKLINSSQKMAAALSASLDTETREKDFTELVVSKVADFSVEKNAQDIAKAQEGLYLRTISDLRSIYESETGKKADTTLSKEELRALIVETRVSKKYENLTKDLIEKVETTTGYEKSTIEAFLSDGSSLTRDELKHLESSSKNLEEVATQLGLTIDELPVKMAEIQKNTEEAFSTSKQNATNLVGEKNSSGVAIVNAADSILKNASLSQYEGYMNNLTTLMGRAAAEGGERAGNTAGNYLNNTLNKLLRGRSQEEQNRILNAFATADLRTETGVKNFIEGLDAVGIEMSKVDMNQLIDDLSELGNVVKDVNLDNLLNQVKSLRDLADSIRDRELNEGITQEEYDQIIKDGAAEADDFYFTGQEFIYLGDSMEVLADALIRVSNDTLDGVIPALENQINSGNAAEKALKTEYVKSLDNSVYNRLLSGELNTSVLGDYNAMRGFLREVFAEEGKGQSVIGMNPAAMKQAYLDAIEAYNNRAKNQVQLDEKQTQVAQAHLYGMSATEMATSGYSQEEINNAIEMKVASEELGLALELIKKDFKATEKEASEYDYLLVDLASNSKKAQRAQHELFEAVSNNADALKESNKGSFEYNTALEEIQKQAETAFGVELPAEFIEKNKDKFLQLAQGGETGRKAFYDLGKLAAEEYLNGLDNLKSNTENIVAEILSIIPEEAKMGITADMDVTKLMEAAKAAGLTLAQLQTAINALGFSMQIETQDYYVNTKTGKKILSQDIINQTDKADWKLITEAKSSVITGNGGVNPVKTSGGSSSKWENPYDKQYNTLEKINEAIRRRELLEKKLQLLQAQGLASEKDYLDTYKQIESNLKYQLKLQEELRAGRKEELNDLLAANAQFSKYAKYNESSGTLSIDYAAINSIKKTDTKTGEALEKFVSELERIVGALEDIETEIIEIEQNQAELQQEYTDAYLSLEDRTVAALEKIRQDEIDTLQEGFDALTEAEEELADAISKSIDEMRQARENEKTEEDIAEKERRLAYLRQDTTGSNALEIKRLEEEIAEQRENYQDSLIDQSLENLQEQNEAAAEQREKQIELMESQLEHDLETGALVAEATDLINRAMQDGMLTRDDRLWDVLSAGEGWPSKSKIALDEILKELREQFGKASMMGSNGGVSSEADLNKNYMNEMITKYHQAGDVITPEILELNRLRNEKINSPNYKGSQKPIDEKDLETELNKIDQAYDYSSDMIDLYKASGGRITDEIRTLNWRRNEKIDANAYGGSQPQLETEEELIAWLEKHTGIKHKFKTGGLADFTGPAWLDGSKSKPELVLNAQDTQNFIMLKDILSGVLSGAPASKASGGDNYFDIDIQVEEISNDYDVDQMAERIKQNIYEDSMYRNVNAVNFLR